LSPLGRLDENIAGGPSEVETAPGRTLDKAEHTKDARDGRKTSTSLNQSINWFQLATVRDARGAARSALDR